MNYSEIKSKDRVSAEVPDWSREKKRFFEWSPSKSLLAAIRRYQNASNMSFLLRFTVSKIAILQHKFWSIVTGADLPINTKIGGGLLMPHPNGIVVHPASEIGPNCLIFQQVTIGASFSDKPPMIGGHVDIGAGAKILGKISIGNHANIGANAVVLIDIPSNASAVGVPAKIITSK
jgi:serine O-acetyltransferase